MWIFRNWVCVMPRSKKFITYLNLWKLWYFRYILKVREYNISEIGSKLSLNMVESTFYVAMSITQFHCERNKIFSHTCRKQQEQWGRTYTQLLNIFGISFVFRPRTLQINKYHLCCYKNFLYTEGRTDNVRLLLNLKGFIFEIETIF